MNCQTIFDISVVGYRYWPVVAGGVLASAVLFLGVIFRERIRRWSTNRYPAVMPFLMFGFMVYWTVAVFNDSYGAYKTLRDMTVSGKAQVVEGIVEEYRPDYGPGETGQRGESFRVEGTWFKYYGASLGAPGFHENGRIQKGQHVRVTYVGEDIAKLDICK